MVAPAPAEAFKDEAREPRKGWREGGSDPSVPLLLSSPPVFTRGSRPFLLASRPKGRSLHLFSPL